MKHIKPLILNCLICIVYFSLSPQTVKSQERTNLTGYILTASADTLWGEFGRGDHHNRTRIISFRKIGQDFFTRYRPGSIRKYLIQEEAAYYSKTVHIEGEGELTLFLRNDFAGEAGLFSAMLDDERLEIFAYDPQGNLVNFSSDDYINQLVDFFGECSHIMRDLSTAGRRYRYLAPDFENLFRQYHACAGLEVSPKEEYPDVQFYTPPEKVRFGIIAGLNRSNFELTGNRNMFYGLPIDYVNGFTIGIFADIPIKDRIFYFKPEFFYSTLGGERITEGKDEIFPILLDNSRIEARFSYVGINLHFRYHVIRLTENAVYVSAGVSAQTFASSRAKIYRTSNNTVSETDLIRNYEPANYGINVGVGASFNLSGLSFITEGRYNTYLNTLGDRNSSFRINAFEFLLAYRI